MRRSALDVLDMTRRLSRHATALALPLMLLLGVGTVSAFQPAIVAVQPLRERIVEIDAEVQRLNERLTAPHVSAEDRAEAYRRYQALVTERERLRQRVAEVSDPARENPLILYASPRGATLTVPPELKDLERQRALARAQAAIAAQPSASDAGRLPMRGIDDQNSARSIARE